MLLLLLTMLSLSVSFIAHKLYIVTCHAATPSTRGPLPSSTPNFCYPIVVFDTSWGFSVVSVPNYIYEIVAKDLKIICRAIFCIFTHFPMDRWWWLKPSPSSNEFSITILKRSIIGFKNVKNKVFWPQIHEEFDKNGPEEVGALIWTEYELFSNG